MTSRKQYEDTSLRPERASSSPPLVSVFVESTLIAETTSPISTHKRNEPSTCRVKRTDVRRERYRLPYSYSYSSSLMMTPASSSTVEMFHRRVGRYGIPMTCYLTRRAVRRRTSSTDAWEHAAVSVGAPCRSCRTRRHRTILISSP